MKVSQESTDLIRELTIKFLNHLADQSNHICLRESKKTISMDHVASSLKGMKMETYLAKILKCDETELQDLNANQLKKKMKVNVVRRQKGSKNKMTEEERLELAKQQAQMFAKAEEEKNKEPEPTPEENTEAQANVPVMTLEQFAPIRFQQLSQDEQQVLLSYPAESQTQFLEEQYRTAIEKGFIAAPSPGLVAPIAVPAAQPSEAPQSSRIKEVEEDFE